MTTTIRDARLTAAQKRHLVELYGDGTQTLYWSMTPRSPEHRSAEALSRKGLLVEEGSIISRGGGGYRLTLEGREVAAALAAVGPGEETAG